MEGFKGDAINDTVTAVGKLRTADLGQDVDIPSDTPFSYHNPAQLWHTPYEDAIGCLPLELVANIFQYVDLLTVIRSRRVCHKWAVLLSSQDVMYAVLHPWLAPHESFSNSVHGPVMSPSAIAARVEAFSTGRPYNVCTRYRNRNWDGRSIDSVIDVTGHVAYADGFLAWIDSEALTTNLLNLWSGKSKAWSFRNQAIASLLAVSESLFAACDHSGIVTVYNHRSHDEFHFRLPTSDGQSMVTKGHTVAVLNESDVTVWSATTQQARQVHLDIDRAGKTISQRYGLLFGADETDLRYYETLDDTEITFVRVPLDNPLPPSVATAEALASSPDPPALDTHPIPAPTHDDIPRLSSPHGLHTLCAVQPAAGTVLIGYDASSPRPRFAQIGGGAARGLLWKAVVYKSHLVPTTGGRSRRLSVADCRDGSDSRWRLTGMAARPVRAEGRGAAREVGVEDVRLLGDEHFLVQAFADRVVVHAFDRGGGEGWRRLRM